MIHTTTNSSGNVKYIIRLLIPDSLFDVAMVSYGIIH